MHQVLAGALLTVATLAACADGSLPTAADPAGGAAFNAGTPVDASAGPLDLAVIGDVPYGDVAFSEFPTLIDAINADPSVRVVVHVGDIKSGSTVCSDAWFEEIARQFSTFADPLIYAIGDNEWTDCHRANNGGYNPLDRLAEIRQLFFSNPGHALGSRPMRTEAAPGYPEDQLWVRSRVTFSSYHIIGSNNGLDPWFGGAETPDQTASREQEVAARNAANIAWLEHAFDTARETRSVGVVLFLQADMWHPEDREAGADFSAHTAFLTRLAQLASGYDGKVLMVAGDSHNLRVDAGVPWFALYGLTPPANVTQVIVDRSIEDDIDWLRLHVDPRDPGVFSWEQETVQ